MREIHCICPPSPELEERIIRSKQCVLARESLPTEGTADLLDVRSFTLIASRPKRTRPDTFISPTRDAAPVDGTKRALVILVDFSDRTATRSQSDIDDMLFSSGTYPTGSMRDFYQEISYNKLDVIGVVSGAGSGWYRAPNPKTYYTDGNYGFGNYPNNAQKLVEDVIDLADPYVNFADYDNDGDGIVDALIIIAAGSGAEAGGDVNDLWSHKWDISPKTVDGVKVKTYFMAPEDGRVGVMSHELGHLLCKWPDLYDTDYSSRGTGCWDLMAGGSWNGNGDRPAHPVAWCKIRVGWVQPTTIFNTARTVTMQPYTTNDQVYKLPIGNKEYFLLSNRQQAGFDNQLPGEGLIIEHVDDNQSSNTDETHYLVDIEQCDGARHLNTNTNRGDANDPFPCASNSEFTGNSTPNSDNYNGLGSNVSVTNIQRSGSNITADINIVGHYSGNFFLRWFNSIVIWFKRIFRMRD